MSVSLDMARIILIGLLLSLGGCMLPGSVTYLSPEKTSEVHISASNRGPDEVLKLETPSGTDMTLIVFDLDDGTLIRFFFDLPEGHSFQMIQNHFKVRTSQTTDATIIAIEKIEAGEIINNVGRPIAFRPLERISGATYQIRATSGKKISVPRSVYIEVKSNARLPDEFDFILPKLTIDDKPFNASPIHFVRRTGTFFRGSAPW